MSSTESTESFDAERVAVVVAGIWAEVLGTEVIPEADFFLLGGHSLLATQMIARVERSLGVRLKLRHVLDHPELAAFTDLVAGLVQDADLSASPA
ncbi:acyl carrier protein [Streptacidiphilus sp. MAP12-33]|uniref:phosphopantetheine-binding protein n=1 Tax=Streptacidiphilus sp. MAP12-33 TaxID=3156266 RepID=UPI003517339A